MKNERILTSTDAATIARLSEHLLRLAATQTNVGEQLHELLTASAILPPGEHDHEHVSLHCEARYLDVLTGEEHTITIVQPQDSDAGRGNISILSPVAIALMGCSRGTVVDAPLPFGRTQSLKITHVRCKQCAPAPHESR